MWLHSIWNWNYFCEYNLAVKFDEKRYVDRDRISEQKRQEALEKRVDCKFITTNPNKENYDVDCEIGKIQTFMSEFKKKRLKEEQIEKLKEKIIIKDGANKGK